MPLNNKWVNNKITEAIKNTLRQMKMKTQPPKNLSDRAKAVLRGKFIALQADLKKREISI